jgi:hypothetical protein
MTRAMLEEVKNRFRRIVGKKFERWEKQNPEPDVPSRILQKVEREQQDWRKRKQQYEETVIEARDKFFDRIVFDHENAMLLLKDFEKLEL